MTLSHEPEPMDFKSIVVQLIKEENNSVSGLDKSKPKIALTSSQVDFFLPVYPGEKVTVVSEKEVFRFNKLKCNVKLYNEKEELVCRGKISGMLKN